MEKTQTFNDYNKIECPHCKSIQKYETCDGELSDVITMWGENVPQQYECQDCEKPFFILESVIRDWEIAKKEEDYD